MLLFGDEDGVVLVPESLVPEVPDVPELGGVVGVAAGGVALSLGGVADGVVAGVVASLLVGWFWSAGRLWQPPSTARPSAAMKTSEVEWRIMIPFRSWWKSVLR